MAAKSYARWRWRESELANASVFKRLLTRLKMVQFQNRYGRVMITPFLGRFHTCGWLIVSFSSSG